MNAHQLHPNAPLSTALFPSPPDNPYMTTEDGIVPIEKL